MSSCTISSDSDKFRAYFKYYKQRNKPNSLTDVIDFCEPTVNQVSVFTWLRLIELFVFKLVKKLLIVIVERKMKISNSWDADNLHTIRKRIYIPF